MQFDRRIQQMMHKAINQIGLLNVNSEWIKEDVRNMGIKFRNHSSDIDAIDGMLKNKDRLIKQAWKLGKAHELLNKGLLNDDGTLTKQAIEYVKKQQSGEIPSGMIPGDLLLEISMFKPEGR